MPNMFRNRSAMGALPQMNFVPKADSPVVLGLTWSSISTGAYNSVIIDEQGLCIALGNAGIYKSTDSGNNWTPTNMTSGVFYKGYANKATQVYLASHATTGIWKSTDGATWVQTNKTSGSITALVGNGSGVYLAGTNTGGIFRSVDGQTWTSVTSPQNYITILYYSEYYNMFFAGTNDNGLYKSTNGVTWTYVAHTGKCIQALGGCGNVILLSFGNSPYTGVLRSTDTVTWTQTSIVSDYTDGPIISNSDNSVVILRHSDTKIYRSVDSGATFTAVDSIPGSYYNLSYSKSSNKFFAAVATKGIYRSPN